MLNRDAGVLHGAFDIKGSGEYSRGRRSIELKMIVVD